MPEKCQAKNRHRGFVTLPAHGEAYESRIEGEVAFAKRWYEFSSTITKLFTG